MNPSVALAGIAVGALTVAALVLIGISPLLALLAYPFAGAAAIVLVALLKLALRPHAGMRRPGRVWSSKNREGIAFRFLASIRGH